MEDHESIKHLLNFLINNTELHCRHDCYCYHECSKWQEGNWHCPYAKGIWDDKDLNIDDQNCIVKQVCSKGVNVLYLAIRVWLLKNDHQNLDQNIWLNNPFRIPLEKLFRIQVLFVSSISVVLGVDHEIFLI